MPSKRTRRKPGPPLRPVPAAYLGGLDKPRLVCVSCERKGGVVERMDTALLCRLCGHAWAPRRRLEADVLAGVLSTLSARPDVDVWRRNTGALYDRFGRLVEFGIDGGADVDGIVELELAGVRVGIRLEVECKRPAWRDPVTGKRYRRGTSRPAQVAFGAMLNGRHGIYLVADSVDSAVEQLDAKLEELLR